jgi:hypothetical protein
MVKISVTPAFRARMPRLPGKMGMVYGRGVLLGEKHRISGHAEVGVKERGRQERQDSRRRGQDELHTAH